MVAGVSDREAIGKQLQCRAIRGHGKRKQLNPSRGLDGPTHGSGCFCPPSPKLTGKHTGRSSYWTRFKAFAPLGWMAPLIYLSIE